MTEVPSIPTTAMSGATGRRLAAGLIKTAGISAGDRVLDVGCGTGQLTRALADLVGGHNVAAIDPSEAVLAVCRARVPEADVRAASAEAPAVHGR